MSRDITQVEADIQKILRDCAEENWDGYGAIPVDIRCVGMALNFVRSLPDYIPLPSVGADPDGEISLDWNEEGKRLSISVGPAGGLSYAWLNGNKSDHGVWYWNATEISNYLLCHINDILRAVRE